MITICKGTHINNNFSLIAYKNSIKIGRNCFVGVNFCVLSIAHRNKEMYIKSANTEIVYSYFIGNNMLFLKE